METDKEKACNRTGENVPLRGHRAKSPEYRKELEQIDGIVFRCGCRQNISHDR